MLPTRPKQTWDAVESDDGTMIAFTTIGAGPALLLIPGALAKADDLRLLARELATCFTVHTIERRGRGRSADRPDTYSIERECEDVLAVSLATGTSLLFGHSFGGLLALEAARGQTAITRVAVYEPGVSVDGSIPTGWVTGCRAKLAQGRGFDAFVEFVRGVNPESAGRAPAWLLKLILHLAIRGAEREQKIELLPTAIREHLEAARLDNSYRYYGEIGADVLLLAGKVAKKGNYPLADLLCSAINQAHQLTFPALDHFGPERDAARVAFVLAAFFNGRL